MEATARQTVEYTFPLEYHGHAIYREPPFHIVEEFKAHVKETNTPETFPRLYWGRLKTTEPFEILHQFAVDRKKRPEGDYIPCPMCRNREKFLEGSLVFLFGRQCVAIIGHNCASAEVMHAALSKKKRDDARRHQEDFLMSRLVHVPGMLRELEALKPIACELEHIFRQFRTGAPSIQNGLRRVRKDGGEYKLSELVDNEATMHRRGPSTKVARDYNFGNLGGEALVRHGCKFVSDLRRYEQWLLSFKGCEDEAAALDMTIGLLDRQEANKAVQYLGEAGRKLNQLRWEMASTCAFFSEIHIHNMRRWATHALQPQPFSVERQVQHDGIAITLSKNTGRDDEREYARLVLRDELAEWAEANRRIPASATKGKTASAGGGAQATSP